MSLSRLIQIVALDRFHLRVTGLEKLPAHGPFIICSNHQSFIDPIILGSVLPWRIFRDTFAVGTSEIFGKGFMRTLAHWLRVVVVDPDANLIPAMRAGAYGLGRGGVLMLYPEGERSIDGHAENVQERRGDPLHSHCRRRLFLWRLKVFMKRGRAGNFPEICTVANQFWRCDSSSA